MVFIEVILLVVLVPSILYFLMRKKSPKDAQQEADKILGSAISSMDYCAANEISEEELLKRVENSELRAYETMGMLFVENKSISDHGK